MTLKDLTQKQMLYGVAIAALSGGSGLTLGSVVEHFTADANLAEAIVEETAARAKGDADLQLKYERQWGKYGVLLERVVKLEGKHGH